MHLVCLGVTRRLLHLLTRGPLTCRLSGIRRDEISDHLVSLRNSVPREFGRHPRSLKEMDRWKAAEFRQILLYTGILVLKRKISKEIYSHYLILTIAMHILLNPGLCQMYSEYAQKIFVLFVEQVGSVYGRDQYVYNVHGLIHLASDAKKFGTLDDISSFPFENFLQKLKKLVRKPS